VVLGRKFLETPALDTYNRCVLKGVIVAKIEISRCSSYMLCACALSNQIFYLRAASFQNSSKGMTNDEHFSTSSLAEEATVIEKWHELNLQWKRTSHVTTMSKCQ